MSDLVALAVPLAVVGGIAVLAHLWLRRRVPSERRTGVHSPMSTVYLVVVVVAVVVFVPLAVVALARG